MITSYLGTGFNCDVMFRKVLCIISVVTFGVLTAIGQNRAPAFAMNERLGRGVNMGNSFEAPAETEWGNPWKPEYFTIISELGFNHVRVPIRWEPADRSSATVPYTINPTFLSRIKEVVDAGLRNKLHVIINMHHHEALYENPAAQKARFLSQWEQIADYFKDYSDSLLFEVLNEPHGNLTPSLWNEYFADALAEIRETNPTRVVLMGVADYGGLSGIPQLELPDDEYIILSPHYYNPFQFTHQGADWSEGSDAWLGTKWMDTESEREAVASDFNYAIQFSQDNHIPIHVGEFGAYSAADLASRARWTTFLGRWFEEQNFSWAYWEFSAGFGIYDPSTDKYLTALIDALLHNEMPAPMPITATPVYTSNFTSGTDGWTLGLQSGAAGNLSASNNALNIAITSPGTEVWHVQLVKNNILLEKDKLYRITFTARAEADRSVGYYAGRASDPWNIYGGSNALLTTSEADFSYTFTMISPSDSKARLVFDLGTSATDVTILNVALDVISFTEPSDDPTETPVTGLHGEVNRSAAVFYPNPVSSTLNVPNLQMYREAELIDMKGRSCGRIKITKGITFLNLDKVPPGVYLLKLQGEGGSEITRIVKK